MVRIQIFVNVKTLHVPCTWGCSRLFTLTPCITQSVIRRLISPIIFQYTIPTQRRPTQTKFAPSEKTLGAMASRKTNKRARTWRIRAEMPEIDIVSRYGGHPTIFSILLHHGGEFTNFPRRKSIGGKKTFVDLLDKDKFCIYDIYDMMDELGYVSEGNLLYYHFKSHVADLDFVLFALGSDEDALYLGTFVAQHKLIEVCIEHDKTKLYTYLMSLSHSKVRIVEFSEPPSCSKRLFLEWHDDPKATDVGQPIPNNDMTDMEGSNGDVGEFGDPIPNDDVTEFVDLGSDGGGSNGDDGSDSEDSEFLVDEDNILDDEDVDMRDFEMNIDKDAEWVGGSSKTVVDEGTNEDDIEVINNEVLLSGSSSDEEMGGKRKKSIRAIRRAHENDEALVSDPFCVLRTFGSAKEFKDKVKLHAIETTRELELEKNDKNRVRWLCKGTLPNLGADQQVEEKCTWVLYASKWKKDANWTVKTYNKEHKCLQTRSVKACTYRFLSSQIVDQVESNPTIPIRALQEQLQRTYKVDLSRMKAFRARAEALNLVRGDYATQYSLLRDYILELQTCNPNTTVKVDVESETRTSRRIYICLDALKQGFAVGKRDFLGLDGAFMKGPYPGQILTAVGLYGNNGTYPLAFAVNKCLQKTLICDWWGILSAIATLFPSAENRYCVHHIRDNMKLRWRGKPFEEALWKCANATHVREFNQCMEEVKKLNNDCYEWLKNLPPQHWSKSHFTGRAHTDVILNNLCETLNGKLVNGHDKPIITCLDFIRDYIMKKIANVEKPLEKLLVL